MFVALPFIALLAAVAFGYVSKLNNGKTSLSPRHSEEPGFPPSDPAPRSTSETGVTISRQRVAQLVRLIRLGPLAVALILLGFFCGNVMDIRRSIAVGRGHYVAQSITSPGTRQEKNIDRRRLGIANDVHYRFL